MVSITLFHKEHEAQWKLFSPRAADQHRRSASVETLVEAFGSRTYGMGLGPGRPVKTHGRPHGQGRAAHAEPTYLGPRFGPARPIEFGDDGPRPGPVHRPRRVNLYNSSARPGLSYFQTPRPGLARTIIVSQYRLGPPADDVP